MDRFIGCHRKNEQQENIDLKSNMDRFIGVTPFPIDQEGCEFKIQYG